MSYWRRGKSSGSSRSTSSNVWQQAGATLSISNACSEYGVTEEQCREAKLDCQYRSYFGNPVCIVKRSDVIELKNKLVKEEEEAKEKAAIEKYGAEEWERMKQQAKEKKETEAAAAKAARDRANAKQQISEQLVKILKFTVGSKGATEPVMIENVTMAKTKAKREWFLNDHDLKNVESTTEGRSVKYAIADLIQASKGKHSDLEEKLLKRNEADSMGMYVAYLQNKLHQDHPPDLVQEASEHTQALLKNEIQQAESKVREAQAQVVQKQSSLACLEAMMIPAATLADSTNGNNDNPSPPKKAKTT